MIEPYRQLSGGCGMKYLSNVSDIFKKYDVSLENDQQHARSYSDDALLQEVADQVIAGDDELVLEAVRTALQSKSPLDIIEKGLVPGMDEVGRLWAEGIHFLPQVVLSSDAMLAGIEICEEKMGQPMKKKGKVVTHTAEGDIHDIGQSIANALLRSAGYEVIDLGSDVPVEHVIQACREQRPIMVTGTALMTTTMTAFPRIAGKLKELNLQIPFICAGGAVSEEFVAGFDLGIWGREVSWAIEMAADALKGISWQEMRAKWNG